MEVHHLEKQAGCCQEYDNNLCNRKTGLCILSSLRSGIDCGSSETFRLIYLFTYLLIHLFIYFRNALRQSKKLKMSRSPDVKSVVERERRKGRIFPYPPECAPQNVKCGVCANNFAHTTKYQCQKCESVFQCTVGRHTWALHRVHLNSPSGMYYYYLSEILLTIIPIIKLINGQNQGRNCIGKSLKNISANVSSAT